jgi:hypothetical protein
MLGGQRAFKSSQPKFILKISDGFMQRNSSLMKIGFLQ